MRTKVQVRRWITAVTAVATVLVVTAAGAAIHSAVDGGGPQPEDVLPANAVAFVKLDLNPSTGQKLAVYRLASRFPKVKSKVTSEDTSIKESVFGSIFTGPTTKAGFGLDYKKDVEPWLGDRIGVGVFPAVGGSKEPEVGVAIEVTDQKAAKVALDKAIVNAANSPTVGVKPKPTGYAFTGGYVIVSDTTAHATALAQRGKVNPLAKSTYAEDVKALGSDQIGVAWTDIAAVYKAIPMGQLGQSPFGMLKGSLKGANDPKNASGRLVMGLHADPSFLEVTGKVIGMKGVDPQAKGGTGTALIASFPSEVFAAATVTGLGKAAGLLYTSLTAAGDPMGIKMALGGMGISSATQVETLLGAETGVMVGGAKDQDAPELAIRTRGSNPEGALAIARRVLGANPNIAMGVTTRKITGPEGIVVGVGSELTAAIFDPSGSKLGDTKAFKQVIPDADRADFAAYVNLAKVIPLVAEGSPKDAASLKPLNAMGMTLTGGTEPTIRVRISVR